MTSTPFVKALLLVLLTTGLSGAAGPEPDAPVLMKPSPAGPPVPSAALDEATFKRSVFRHIYVGAISYPGGVRRTWVLLSSPTRVRLRVLCQTAKPRGAFGLRIDGTENDEASWLPPVIIDYEGTSSRKGVSVRTSNTTPVSGSCGMFPREIALTCRPATVTVLAAGAVAKPGASTPDGGSKELRRGPDVPDTRSPLPLDPSTLKARVHA